ncbi:MAG: aminotransferase class I/II-fold pyridoxal phosphate-dependent enzyme [Raoultibacter sp.]
MVNGRIRLSSPTMHGEEMQYIQEAFDKNWVAPLGFNCDGFEAEMADYLKNVGAGSNHDLYTLCLVSGTSALHLAVKLAGVKPGDIVLCSDLTFAATVNPISYEGGVQVFIDSERETWNMDPEALEEGFRLHPEAKVVMLAHLYGTPSKMDEIKAVCKAHGAILIEDAAEALGATYHSRACGTFGNLAALSFNGNKIITTSSGGMLITRNEMQRDKALFWATQSREDTLWYQHEELGYNYRMSNVLAGIGRGQMKHLEEHCALKEKIYRRYQEGLKGLPVSMNPYLPDTTPNFWLSCLLIDQDAMCKVERTGMTTHWQHEPGKTCPDEIGQMLGMNNIETRPIWKPMHMQPIYKDNGFVDTGVGKDVFARGLCLPSDIKMSEEEQDSVMEIIRGCFC